MAGSIDSPGLPRKLGVVDQQAEKGQPVCISFSAFPLAPGTHTIGVYSVTSAISVCPRVDSTRQFGGFTIEKSYHTANQKGHFNIRAGEDEYDFCGELSVSY